MRTITVETKIYKYEELPENIRDTIRQNFAIRDGYLLAETAFDSLKALADKFNTKIKDSSIDFFNSTHSYITFETPEMEPEEIKSILDTLGNFNPLTLKGTGECLLTGYCADEDAIDGFRIAFHNGETDLNKLLQAAFENWLKIQQDDCENSYTDGSFREFLIGNEYEFYEDGTIYHK